MLAKALHDAPPGPILVGFSGGMDSTCLLSALASLPEARQRGLRAIHVDHGLAANSAAWAEHCRRVAADLGVPVRVIAVSVSGRQPSGPEAAARRARRTAFREELGAGELLALAQHRDDQAETFLLRLMRGAGTDGLAAMRSLGRFAPGWIWRPWLELSRADLKAYAEDRQLHWIEDPSNAETRFDRNFLRFEILPRLTERWTSASTAIARSAAWCAAAARSLEKETRALLADIQSPDGNALQLAAWSVLPEVQRGLLLRLWLRDRGLAEPQHFKLVELMRQLIEAGGDRNPTARWPGAELRRYGGWVYAMAPLAALDKHWSVAWNGCAPLALPEGCGRLNLEPAEASTQALLAATFEPALQVSLRRGGERLRPSGQAHTRELKHLFQEIGMPPWQRARVPLIYQGDALLAVGDLWMTQAGTDQLAARGQRLIWEREALAVTYKAQPIGAAGIECGPDRSQDR